MSLFKLIQRIVTEFALIISVIASVLVPGVSQGNTVRIMLSHPCQRFDSWGTSGAWWSQHVGNSAVDEQVAELLFDKESGLGLQIYRYNIGGGEAENPNSRIWGNWTKTESFYVLNEQTGK